MRIDVRHCALSQLTQIGLALHFVDGHPGKTLEEDPGDPGVDQGVANDEHVEQGFAWKSQRLRIR